VEIPVADDAAREEPVGVHAEHGDAARPHEPRLHRIFLEYRHVDQVVARLGDAPGGIRVGGLRSALQVAGERTAHRERGKQVGGVRHVLRNRRRMRPQATVAGRVDGLQEARQICGDRRRPGGWDSGDQVHQGLRPEDATVAGGRMFGGREALGAEQTRQLGRERLDLDPLIAGQLERGAPPAA